MSAESRDHGALRDLAEAMGILPHLRALDTARAGTPGAVHHDLRQEIAPQLIVAFEVGAVT